MTARMPRSNTVHSRRFAAAAVTPAGVSR
jgi:hypothetical protein